MKCPAMRVRTHRFLLVFYLLVLFSARDYIQAFLQFTFLYLFASSPLQKPQIGRELLQVHVLFKHGHRAPFRIHRKDPNPRSLWPEGLGMLTQLGRLQQYTVGKYLRHRYRDLITTNPMEIEVQSSDAKRCLYGAYSFLAGMYSPSPEWAIGEEVPWQPIPVMYVPEPEEKYLQSNPNCDASEKEKKRLMQTPEALKFIEKHKPYYEYWASHSGKYVTNWDNAGDLYKTLSVERDNNYTMPNWVLRYWDELTFQADIAYYWHFKTKLLQRLRAGPILGLVMDRMKEKITEKNKQTKVFVYSGHGSNVAAILCALQLYNMKQAPHGATLVWELYREGNGHTVRFIYLNSTTPEKFVPPPHVYTLHGCTEFCPIEFWEDYVGDLVPTDWKKECQQEQSEEFPDEDIKIQYAETVPYSSSSSRVFLQLVWLILSLVSVLAFPK